MCLVRIQTSISTNKMFLEYNPAIIQLKTFHFFEPAINFRDSVEIYFFEKMYKIMAPILRK